MKNSWKCCGFGFLAVDNLDFTRKIVKTFKILSVRGRLRPKIRKMQIKNYFVQWIFSFPFLKRNLSIELENHIPMVMLRQKNWFGLKTPNCTPPLPSGATRRTMRAFSATALQKQNPPKKPFDKLVPSAARCHCRQTPRWFHKAFLSLESQPHLRAKWGQDGRPRIALKGTFFKTLFKILIFGPKIQLWFPEKIVDFFLGEKLVKMLWFWAF